MESRVSGFVGDLHLRRPILSVTATQTSTCSRVPSFSRSVNRLPSASPRAGSSMPDSHVPAPSVADIEDSEITSSAGPEKLPAAASRLWCIANIATVDDESTASPQMPRAQCEWLQRRGGCM